MKTRLRCGFLLSLALLLVLAESSPVGAADVPVSEDTSTSPSDTLTEASGRATSLTVQATRDALLRFDLSSLPAGYTTDTLRSARLRVYVSKVSNAGDLSVHPVTQDWSEGAAGPAPLFDVAPLATIPAAGVRAKGFIVFDVTAIAHAWLSDPSTNFGVAVVADAGAQSMKLSLAAKESPKNGPAAELELEADLQSGTNNDPGPTTSVILGGQDNVIDPSADYAVVPGGLSNEIGPSGDYSFAAGRRAMALHQGSFVWADSTDADFSSTMDDQFRIRAANGLSLASNAGGAKAVPAGTYFRDNAIFAWGRVTTGGTLDSDFNVASVVHVSTGVYTIALASNLSSGFSLMDIVTPEVDSTMPPPGTPTPPVGAAAARFAVVDNVAPGDTFNVYMYNGLFALVDNDFQFIVTGR